MSEYLKLARQSAKKRRLGQLSSKSQGIGCDQSDISSAAVGELGNTGGPGNAEGETLAATGWQPKERLGKTIWRDPQDGFWLSQEMALVILERRK